MSREARAKRRRGIHSDEMMDGKQQVVEKLEVAKAPGDEDDWTYKTPRRPLKRARRTSEADEHDDHDHGEEEKKKLRWDRVVSVIRDDGNASGSAKSSDDGKEKDGEELKSCIKTKVGTVNFFFFFFELINENTKRYLLTSMATCWMRRDLLIISNEQELWLLQCFMTEKNQFLHRQQLRDQRRSNLAIIEKEVTC